MVEYQNKEYINRKFYRIKFNAKIFEIEPKKSLKTIIFKNFILKTKFSSSNYD